MILDNGIIWEIDKLNAYLYVSLLNFHMFFWNCSIECQRLMTRKVALIKKRDFLWLCSVTGFLLPHDPLQLKKYKKKERGIRYKLFWWYHLQCISSDFYPIKWAWISKRYLPYQTSLILFTSIGTQMLRKRWIHLLNKRHGRNIKLVNISVLLRSL